MRVGDLARTSVAVLEVDDTLADAAREMEESSLAAVVVCEGGVLVGIITERDVIRAAADQAPFDRTGIEEYMTAAPVTLPRDAEPAEGLRLMLDGGFRHLPVVDNGEAVALLTMRDLVGALIPVKS